MATHGTSRLFAIGSLILGACSVVNDFDEVAPRASDDDGGTGPTGGTNSGGTAGSSTAGSSTAGAATSGNGGAPNGGSSGDVGVGGDSPAGGTPGSEGGAGGEPGTVRPIPDRGLIVVGGTDLDGSTSLLAVLNAATGEELDREELSLGATVAGLAYDGAEGKDVWFVFVASDFPAKTDKVANLQVRYFNDRTNNWVTLSRLTTLPPPVPGSFAVLNDRLAYLSHTVQPGGKVTPSLTILDTSDVRDVKVITFDEPDVAGDRVLLLGTRGTADDRAGLGGTLDLALAQNCAGETCDLFVQPISIGSTVSSGVGHVIGTYRGTPVGAASTRQLNDYFAFAPPSGSVVVSRIVPDAPEDPVTSNAPPMVTDLSALALAECQQVVLFTAYTTNALYGVTSSGVGRTQLLGRPGQLVAYEPFTRDAITTYNPPDDGFLSGAGGAGGASGAEPGPEISAVRVTSTSSANLSLALRTGAGWRPPDDVRVNALATRIPYPLECP